METAAVIQLAIALLPMVQTGITEFVAWITALRSASMQAGEWTDAQEEAYRKAMLDKGISPAYLPDPIVASVK